MTRAAIDMPRTAAPAETPPPPAQRLIAARFAEPPSYAVHRSGGAPTWLLLWTTGGVGKASHCRDWLPLHPGDLALLPAGHGHAYRTAPDAACWRGWWTHFQPRPTWLAWLHPYATTDGIYLMPAVPAAVHARIDSAFRRLHADARWSGGEAPPTQVAPASTPTSYAMADAGTAHELAIGAIEEVLLLAHTSVVAAARSADAGTDPRVLRAVALMTAEPASPHTVRSLATYVHLSPSRFAHLFASQTGHGPMRALRDVRLSHAQRLLGATDLTVGQVAGASGFASQFHFSRTFRAKYGLAPGAYRASVQG